MPTRVETLKRTLVSQFGGYGGGSGGSSSSGYSPGGSPIGKNGTSSSGFNSYFPDESFDAMLNSARHDDERFADETNTTEKQLTKFHVCAEQDAINYTLTDKERERFRIKQNVYEREKNAQDSINNVIKNSPSYIRTHFFPKPETMRTIEESLLGKHLNDETRKDPRENTVPEQEHPERDNISDVRSSSSRLKRFVLAAPPTHGRTTIFDVNPDEDTDKDTSIGNPWAHQYDSFSIGGYGQSGDVVRNQQDYEKSIEGGDQATQSYHPFNTYEPLTFKFPGSDEVNFTGGPNQVQDTPSTLPKHKTDGQESANDVNVPTEERLRRLKVQKTPRRLPGLHNDAFDGEDNLFDIFGSDGLESKMAPGKTPDTSGGPTTTVGW